MGIPARRSRGLFCAAPRPPPPPLPSSITWRRNATGGSFRPTFHPTRLFCFCFFLPLALEGEEEEMMPTQHSAERNTQLWPCSKAQRSYSAAAPSRGSAVTHAINMEVTCSAPRTTDKKRCQTGSGCQQRRLGWICWLQTPSNNAAPMDGAHGATQFTR